MFYFLGLITKYSNKKLELSSYLCTKKYHSKTTNPSNNTTIKKNLGALFKHVNRPAIIKISAKSVMAAYTT
jgi:hypothetical protein